MKQRIRSDQASIAKKVKALVNKTMGVRGNPPDPKAGKALLELVEEAERDRDTRIYEAMTAAGVSDILLWAAGEGHTILVKRLLEAGVSPTLSSFGVHALSCAAQGGRTDVVDLLLSAGEKANRPGLMDKPVVLEAAEKGHDETVLALIGHGADVDACDPVNGETVLLVLAPRAQPGTVRRLVEKGADANACSDEGYTALMSAAAAGNIPAVTELIELGADVNRQMRLRSIEAMEKEGRGEFYSGNKALRKMRAARKDPLGTALMLAAQNGQAEVAELLLKARADSALRDAEGRTAMDLAEANGHPTVLRVLRGGSAGGAPETGIRDLLRAVEQRNVEQVQAAIRAGVDVNAKTFVTYDGNINEGFTPRGGKPPLVIAAQQGDLAMVNVLLEAGADPNLRAEATLFDNGQNALHAAAGNGHLEIVRALLAAGARTNAKEAGRPNIPGQTPVQLATAGGHKKIVEELLGLNKSLPSGTRAKATKAVPRPQPSLTGLHEAAENGNAELVALLLKQGVDIDALARESRWSPLMFSAFGAHLEVVRQLLDAGANVNATNKLGQTALTVSIHGAWMRSDWDKEKKKEQATIDTIQLLIDRGADVNVSSWGNETPLDMARESGLRKIAALLKKAGGKSSR